jgi:small neutral amino acid transporter SnatA (MarC family)
MQRFRDSTRFGLVGAALGAVLALGFGFLTAQTFGISAAEGSFATGILVFWVPICALVGLLAGAIWGAVR